MLSPASAVPKGRQPFSDLRTPDSPQFAVFQKLSSKRLSSSPEALQRRKIIGRLER